MSDENLPVPANTGEMHIYPTQDGKSKIAVRLDGHTAWLTQAQMAELFDTTPQNITIHIRNVYDEGELSEAATCKDYLQVRAEGSRQVQRPLKHYNLDVIISVGYRVKSRRGTQFRIWATERLREYLIKGFTMDDQKLKQRGGGGYFDELLARIRDIRSSEKVFWRKVLDIYATSEDYDKDNDLSQQFFAVVQNKMHWAAHGHTAAEVVHARADSSKPDMGMTSKAGPRVRKADSEIADFALNPPEIVTGDTYEDGRGVRGDVGVPLRQGRLFDPTASGAIHVNIFNISKINSEVRGDKQPRIKRLHEYIGESYFEYLSKLDDLVLLMDESHRYRASAGVKAINELKPILGLELTATPQVESGKGSTGFKNVIYSYPLSAALNDGFVKEPAVATRENFDARAYDEEGLERLKLEDGVRVHEEAKTQLDVYARDFGARRMKPFMLVVAKDITHANEIVKLIESDEFFDGQYKPAPEGPKVISVHSQAKSEEKDDIVQQLLTVEDPNNSVEIVVHVNMLKEGWDVTNLYTIVPLRTANSRTLVEQSIGRGLRLPYGKRTGVAAVDRLTIISHDKFQEIIDHANDPNSIIRKGVIIGRDIPDTKSKVVVIESNVAQRLGLQSIGTGAQQKQPTLFVKPEEQRAAQVTYQVLRQFERLPSSADLRKPDVQQKIVEQVKAAIAAQGGTQSEFEQFKAKVDFAQVVAKTVDLHIDMSIDIPRIVVVPTGEVTSGFTDFDLDVSPIHLQPVKQRVLIQNLGDGQRYTLETGASVAVEEKLEDYIVRGLMDYPDINYDEHAELMYKLAGQAVAHLKSYLKDEEDVLNVLLVHQRLLVQSVYAQMEAHYVEKATAYEVHVSKGFTTMRPVNGTTAEDEVRDYRAPVDEKKNIRGMLFGGFSKCLYQVQKFDSDTERRLASIFEKDKTVLTWCKPPRDALKIDYARGEVYEPDFVVETETAKFICESKSSDEMHASAVESKARAAATWCDHATKHGGGKPWKYLLIPHEQVDDSKTLAGLAGMYTVSF